jgi:hypothetical protein
MGEMNETIPDSLFDAQLNIQATLAANAASFHGNQAYRHFLHKWERFYAGKVGPNGQIDIGSVARFLLGAGEEETGGFSGNLGRRGGDGPVVGPRRKGPKGGLSQ